MPSSIHSGASAPSRTSKQLKNGDQKPNSSVDGSKAGTVQVRPRTSQVSGVPVVPTQRTLEDIRSQVAQEVAIHAITKAEVVDGGEWSGTHEEIARFLTVSSLYGS